jgi:hypothetical protein
LFFRLEANSRHRFVAQEQTKSSESIQKATPGQQSNSPAESSPSPNIHEFDSDTANPTSHSNSPTESKIDNAGSNSSDAIKSGLHTLSAPPPPTSNPLRYEIEFHSPTRATINLQDMDNVATHEFLITIAGELAGGGNVLKR